MKTGSKRDDMQQRSLSGIKPAAAIIRLNHKATRMPPDMLIKWLDMSPPYSLMHCFHIHLNMFLHMAKQGLAFWCALKL